MWRSSRTSLMPAVLAAKAFFTSSDASSGHLGSARAGSPARQTLLWVRNAILMLTRSLPRPISVVIKARWRLLSYNAKAQNLLC